MASSRFVPGIKLRQKPLGVGQRGLDNLPRAEQAHVEHGREQGHVEIGLEIFLAPREKRFILGP